MSKPNETLYIAGGVVASVLLCAYVALSIVIGEDFAIPGLITGGVVAVLALRGPVGRALADRIHAGAVAQPEIPAELLDELDTMRGRVAELEERVDFTERMLARSQEEGRVALPPT